MVEYIKKAGGLAKAEPSAVSNDNRNRVDVEAHLGSLLLHIDVRITHPTSTSYMPVAMKSLGAAKQAEKEKKRKHGKNAENVGAVFVPYVVETFGGIAPEAETLNKKISTFAEEHSITENREDFLQKLKSEIASAVQYGNYRIATKAIQQSKVALKIPQKNSSVEEFLSDLIDGENTIQQKQDKMVKGSFENNRNKNPP